MSDLAIRIENLSKQYKIGELKQRHDTLRDAMASFGSKLARVMRHPMNGRYDTGRVQADHIWALEDISLEVKQGEVLGIIGHNGAGKSTLLKVLSRITEPTKGRAAIYGRVASLLEVGTGFHFELTGRENVYLNGAILGMSRAEIDHKFDEIVAFAGVEKFIDTPVKRYSSGMAVRLAFAVAAHLEPEILIVDEVLAVGDMAFQRKCINKMQDVGQGGRTVLFVSHNMSAITRLCERAILLNNGSLQLDGSSQQVVGAYLTTGHGTRAVREWPQVSEAPGSDVVRLRAVRVQVEGGDGEYADAVDIRRSVGIEMEYEVLKPGYVCLPHFSLQNEEGLFLFAAIDVDPNWRGRTRPTGRYISTGWIPGNFLAEGTMFAGPAMKTLHPDVVHYYEPEAVAFQVVDSLDGDTARGDNPHPIHGVVRPLLKWDTQFSPSD